MPRSGPVDEFSGLPDEERQRGQDATFDKRARRLSAAVRSLVIHAQNQSSESTPARLIFQPNSHRIRSLSPWRGSSEGLWPMAGITWWMGETAGKPFGRVEVHA